MKVSSALEMRKSVRAFLDRPVPKELIHNILDRARWAPSGTNTQPWEVAVVTGAKKHQICERLEAAFRAGVKPQMDYFYYPQKWFQPFQSRRVECGKQLYGALNIRREDKAARQEQWIANYRAFNAPVVLFFTLNRSLERGSFLDTGMFLQSVMLMAVEEGLATCAQAALGEYPDIVREELNLSSDHLVLCGMALGYEDSSQSVNDYRTQREPVEAFTQFLE